MSPRVLPQISVLSVTQDARGYLWVGTQGGVARFDGLRFVTFDRAHGGVDTTLASSALVDARDRVWFGTPRGAVVLERGAVHELRARDALLTVNALALDAQGASRCSRRSVASCAPRAMRSSPI